MGVSATKHSTHPTWRLVSAVTLSLSEFTVDSRPVNLSTERRSVRKYSFVLVVLIYMGICSY